MVERFLFKQKDHEISGFLLRSGYSLKRIIRVAKELVEREKEEHNEIDAAGRGEE